jgi:hypothetical protein
MKTPIHSPCMCGSRNLEVRQTSDPLDRPHRQMEDYYAVVCLDCGGQGPGIWDEWGSSGKPLAGYNWDNWEIWGGLQ